MLTRAGRGSGGAYERIRAVRSDGGAARQELPGVLEEDDAVAEKAPPLLGVAGEGTCGLAVGRLGCRTGRVVRAHRRASDIS